MSLKKKAVIGVGVVALFSSVLIATTASAASTAVNGPVTVPGAVRGGTITDIAQGDFEHLDPARVYVGATLDLYRLFVRTLTQFKTVNGKITTVPDLASAMPTTADGGVTWVYKLRQGIKYEDGTPVTCEDIKYGVARSYEQSILDGGPTYPRDYIADTNGFAGPYTTPGKSFDGVVCAKDGSTITFKLKNAIPYFPAVTTFGAFSPIPKAKDTKQNYDLHPISTGPYKIQTYDRGKQLVLVRNKYWDPKSDPIRTDYPDKYVFKFGSDQNVVEQEMISDNGEAKTAFATDTNILTNLAKVYNNPAYKSRLFNYDTTYSRYYAINVDTVKDLNIRKAIQCAFDFKQILAAAGGETSGSYSNSTIPSTFNPAYRNFQICGRDVRLHPEAQVDKAKAYIAAAGPGAKTTLHLAFRDKGVEPDRAAALQQELQAAGFTVVMDKYPRAEFYSFISKRGVQNEPDIMQTSWMPDWPLASGTVYPLFDGRTMTATDAGSNYSRDNFPDIQALFAKADTESQNAQEKTLGDIEQNLIVDKAAVMPVYFETSHQMVGSKVGNAYVENGYGDVSMINAYVKK
jgi:peptide/nickel transport system substrate-binding protein